MTTTKISRINFGTGNIINFNVSVHNFMATVITDVHICIYQYALFRQERER